MSTSDICKLLFLFTATIVATLFLTGELVAADGDLDPSFDGDGKVYTDFGSDEFTHDGAIQTNQKIVVVGSALGSNYDFALARYNPDGSLDTTFSGDGKVTTDFGSDDYGQGVEVQNDGKIVVSGKSYVAANGGYMFALARYNSDGSLDTNFSGDGKVTTDFGGDSGANVIAIQTDQKIIAAGYHYAGADSYDFALARYNPDGSLDNSFSGDGMVTTDFAGLGEIAFGIALQTDNKIVLIGFTFNGIDRDFALARYNPDGSLDTGFSGDGKIIEDFSQSINEGTSVAIQNDGKIVAAGGAFWPQSDFALARYNPDGTLDTTFSGDGKVTTDFSGGFEYAFAVMIQTDSKIVAAGPNTSGNSDFHLARYNPDGSLDNTFSGDGKVITDFGGFDDGLDDLILQSDNKIVAVGHSDVSGASDFALARYLSGGTSGTPVANDDNYSTTQDISLNVPPPGVLGNDFDPEGDPLTATLQTTTSNGSLNLSGDGSFVYTPNTGFSGTDSFTYFATDGTNNSNIATVTIVVVASCLFCDDFKDGVLDSNWSYIKPTWTETGGFLLGTPVSRKAIAVATPIFSGCQTCYVESFISTAGGLSNRISLLGWYVDKRNTIELLIKEETDKIILKQRINSKIVTKAKASVTIDPNTPYTFRITFNGTNFIVSINGTQLFTMTPTGIVPVGTVGFQTKNTTGSFGYIIVN